MNTSEQKGILMDLEFLIYEEILSGEYLPGSKINISSMKQKYRVSLAPLREALSRIASAGLLISEPNRGYYVAAMNEQELLDLYQTSAHLEVLALSQAIERGRNAWEGEIVASLYKLEKVELGKIKPSYEDWSQANSRFHNALIGSCSDVVKELRVQIQIKVARYVRVAFGKAVVELGTFHKEHQALADACLQRNKELACKLIQKHSEKGQGLLIEKYKNKDKKNA